MPGVHENLRGCVIELRRFHRTNDRDVIRVLRKVRQYLRDFIAGLPVLLELKRRRLQLRHAFRESKSLALQIFRRAIQSLLLSLLLYQRMLWLEN